MSTPILSAFHQSHPYPIKTSREGETYVMTAFFILACTKILLSYSAGISGNDFWWHAKVGEWIVENRCVPTMDIFSWYGTSLNLPWTAHEWLSDVIFYVLLRYTGQTGVFFLSLLSAIAMFSLLWRQTKEYRESNIVISSAFFFLLSINLNEFFYGRPHLFSFFLMFAELKILFRFTDNPNSKGIYWLPLIACLWSNLHGGSSNMTYILCFVFLICEFLPINIGCIQSCERNLKATGKLAIATVCTAGALLINPIGLRVLVYPYTSLGDNVMMQVISEWQAPDVKNIGTLLFCMVPIALMLLGFLAQKENIRLVDLAIMAVFILLFLRSIRFIMLWFIAAAFCGFRYLPAWEIRIIHTKPKSARFFATLFVVGGVFLAGLAVRNIIPTIQSGALIEKQMSDEAITAVKEYSSQKLFNDYNLGESLIYEDIPVFVDARADLFAYENILADAVSLMSLTQINPDATTPYADVEMLMGKYDFDSYLILKSRPLYTYLRSQSDRFVCVYENDTMALFTIA